MVCGDRRAGFFDIASFPTLGRWAWVTLHQVAVGMVMDDVTLVRGGFYDCSKNAKQYFDVAFSSVTLSNYPGEPPRFANLTGSHALIDVGRVANVKGSGISATNCQRTVLFQNATNCELANCDLGYSDPASTYTGLVAVVSCSRSNWIHANNIHDSHSDYTTTLQSAKGTPFLLGTQETNPADFTAYNRVELNQFFHGGNDCLQVQANCNIIRSNWFHNEPWVTWKDYAQTAGNRNLVISPRSQWNVVDYNQVGYAGVSPETPGGNGIEICGVSNIVRFNEIYWSQQNGLLLDGGRNGGAISAGQCLGNHIYNNSLGWNSLGQLSAWRPVVPDQWRGCHHAGGIGAKWHTTGRGGGGGASPGRAGHPCGYAVAGQQPLPAFRPVSDQGHE